MGAPPDTIVRPMKELIEDESLALKWTNTFNVIRLLSQLAADFMWVATDEGFRDIKTGERLMNVAPETAKFYSSLAIMNSLSCAFRIS
jgi:hypothetical protein